MKPVIRGIFFGTGVFAGVIAFGYGLHKLITLLFEMFGPVGPLVMVGVIGWVLCMFIFVSIVDADSHEADS